MSCAALLDQADDLDQMARDVALLGLELKLLGKAAKAAGAVDFEGEVQIHGYVGGSLSPDLGMTLGAVLEGSGDGVFKLYSVFHNRLRYCSVIEGQRTILGDLAPGATAHSVQSLGADHQRILTDMSALQEALVALPDPAALSDLVQSVDAIDTGVDGLRSELTAVARGVSSVGGDLGRQHALLEQHGARLAGAVIEWSLAAQGGSYRYLPVTEDGGDPPLAPTWPEHDDIGLVYPSPQGRWIAYDSPGGPGLHVRPVRSDASLGAPLLVAPALGAWVLWGKGAPEDEAVLFFDGPDRRLRAVTVIAAPEPRLSTARDTGIDTLTFRSLDTVPGGGFLAVQRSEQELGADRLHVVLGWSSQLPRGEHP